MYQNHSRIGRGSRAFLRGREIALRVSLTGGGAGGPALMASPPRGPREKEERVAASGLQDNCGSSLSRNNLTMKTNKKPGDVEIQRHV